MPRKTLVMMLTLAALCGLGACKGTPGSMTRAEVSDMLSAQRIAVTPRDPGWLLEKDKVHRLSDTDRQIVCDLLRRQPVRVVDEKHYRKAELGTAKDASKKVFYLYADNSQCLGGRVAEGKRVLMDDFDMTDEEAQRLYRLLFPYLHKLFPDLKP